MIRQWRERIQLVPDLLFFAGVSILGFTGIVGSAIFIDYVDSPLTLFQRLDGSALSQKCAKVNSSSRT
jgi:hypothetical protein